LLQIITTIEAIVLRVCIFINFFVKHYNIEQQNTIMIPKYKAKHQTDLQTDNGATPIPRNFFVTSGNDVFKGKIPENHTIEQFFWTNETVNKLLAACEYSFVKTTGCLMSPSLGHGMYEQGREEKVLDIDKRFSYLPGFIQYDITNPKTLDEDFKLLVLDPPFFLIPIEQIRDAVDVLTKKDYSTKIIIAFIIRGEERLRKAFINYQLYPTTLTPQYASIKPNKWKNFRLYSNIDLPGLKRIIDKRVNILPSSHHSL
jgi:Probable N6-adenine methyltransferase